MTLIKSLRKFKGTLSVFFMVNVMRELLITGNMKKNIFLSMILISSFCIKAQQLDHPTISSLEVNYTEDPASDFIPDSVKKVRLNAHITLKNVANVSKVHFKIKNINDSGILYEVAYATGESAVINEAGLTLFKKDETGLVHISSPSLMPLATYQYEISTEDNSELESDMYSSIQ